MARICLSCATENPDEARFCFACATPLGDAGLPRLERKNATVLSADLVGYTSFTEREDPEVVRSIVTRTFDRLTAEIERHGGFIEKFIGDEILALFGVPAAHEDDAKRAVHAALDMQKTLGEVNQELGAEGRGMLAMRIGIEAGEILVAALADLAARRQSGTLTGDAVNTTARLAKAAAPGTVVVGPNVHEATRTVVEYVALAPLRLKGKAEPVAAWEAIRVTTGEPGARSGLRAKLVGRDREIDLLRRTLRDVQSEKRPALVTILGPAGVGKSRLALELERYADGLEEPVPVIKGRCLSYANASYSAFAEAIKNYCGIREDDPPDVIAQKVARNVERLFGDRELAGHIEVLTGSSHDQPYSREDLFDGWRRLVERLAGAQPLVLVFEDIHWADDGLLDFIDHLADWAEGPILMVALARLELLERRAGWGVEKPNYTALHVAPLRSEEIEAMLADLVPTELPGHLRQIVVERCEGNPLFGEEIVRMFIDRGLLRSTSTGWQVADTPSAIEVPRSIQSLIASRIDSLSNEEKSILQDASVVGRVFWDGAVSRVGRRNRDVSNALLTRLETKEIVFPREPSAFSGELQFAFHHVLSRDVAYDSLPKSLRAAKHIDVARWAEEQAVDRSEEIAELLATHYVQALAYLDELGGTDSARSDVQKDAFRWAKAAGERTFRLWQQREAARWFRTALDLAPDVGLPEVEHASLWELYASVGEGVESYADVESALETALTYYERAGTNVDLGRVESRLAHVSYQSGKEESVILSAERALAHLEPMGDSAELAQALSILGRYYRRRAVWDIAEQYAHRAMEMAERVGDRVTQGLAMMNLGSTVLVRDSEAAMTLLESAVQLAREGRDLPLLLRGLVELMEGYEQARGDYRKSEALLREGIELARRAGNIGEAAWMEGNLADVLAFDTGILDEETERLARKGLEQGRAVSELARVGYSLGTLGYIQVTRGDLAQAKLTLEELRPLVGRASDSYMEALEALDIALVAQADGRLEDACEVLATAVDTLGGRVQVFAGQNLLIECVRCLVRAGRQDAATSARDRLQSLARASVPARALAAWADGLLEKDTQQSRELLQEAAAQMEGLGRRIDFGRCLIDLAEAERRLGQDPVPTLAQAREILESAGALLFLREVDQATARNPGPTM